MTSNEYLDLVDEYAKKMGYYPVNYIGDWKGYHVFEPVKNLEPVYTGYPLVVLEKDLKFRMSTHEESLEIMHFFDEEDE